MQAALYTVCAMPSLQETVALALEQLAAQNDEIHTRLDLFRSVQDQALLLYETEHLRTTLLQDPYQKLKEFKLSTFYQRVQVVDCHRVSTLHNYIKIDATVRIPASATMQRNGAQHHVQLVFRYERQGMTVDIDGSPKLAAGSNATYTIDVARDFAPSEKVLWCQVWGDQPHPSHLPAVNVEQDWESADNEEEEAMDTETNENMDVENSGNLLPSAMDLGSPAMTTRRNNSNEEGDRYMAGMDPDVLACFKRWTDLPRMDETAAFFLLMSFPYFEQEWDMVGYVLEAVFGFESDDDTEEDGSNEKAMRLRNTEDADSSGLLSVDSCQGDDEDKFD